MSQLLGVYAIHYSCESFFDDLDGRSRRITSIAVMNLKTGQTNSFSIHQVAEVTRVQPSDIVSQYDSLERDAGRLLQVCKDAQSSAVDSLEYEGH